MSKVLFSIFAILIGIGMTNRSDASFSDRNFEMDRMLSTYDTLLLLSPCEDKDFLSAYSYGGTHFWTISLYTKVISWTVKDNYLYVFSKSRYSDNTYLSCYNINTGYKVWEHP